MRGIQFYGEISHRATRPEVFEKLELWFDEIGHTFIELIFNSETFIIARMGPDVYAVVVNEHKYFETNLNRLCERIYTYRK